MPNCTITVQGLTNRKTESLAYKTVNRELRTVNYLNPLSFPRRGLEPALSEALHQIGAKRSEGVRLNSLKATFRNVAFVNHSFSIQKQIPFPSIICNADKLLNESDMVWPFGNP